MEHAWNLVNLDGNYYHIDVTWNDIKGYGKTQYEYFLVSDNAFRTNRTQPHYDWVTAENCVAENTQYDDNDWRNVNNYLIYKDNYWYYIKNPAKLEEQSNSTFELSKINYRDSQKIEKIRINTSEKLFWFPGLSDDGEKLYFTTKNSIWKMNYDGTESEELYKLSDASKAIYSVEFRNNKFYYDTTDVVNGSSSTESRNTNVYSPTIALEYTNLKVEQIDLISILNFEKRTLISSILTLNNFPIQRIYNIKVLDMDENEKPYDENIGSKNVIRITDKDGNILAEYTIIVPGDVTGNGYVRMYDSFEILKGAVTGNKGLDEIDYLIRDYNQDGNIRMYDAFQYLREAVSGK